MVSIHDALRRVKDDLPQLITQHVHDALEQEKNFVWRCRLLDPVTTMLLFVAQVMHGNTAISHLRHLSPLRFTAAAYCKARRITRASATAVGHGAARQRDDHPGLV